MDSERKAHGIKCRDLGPAPASRLRGVQPRMPPSYRSHLVLYSLSYQRGAGGGRLRGSPWGARGTCPAVLSATIASDRPSRRIAPHRFDPQPDPGNAGVGIEQPCSKPTWRLLRSVYRPSRRIAPHRFDPQPDPGNAGVGIEQPCSKPTWRLLRSVCHEGSSSLVPNRRGACLEAFAMNERTGPYGKRGARF